MSDPYGIARQGAQANGMLNSLKKEMYQKSFNRMSKRVGTNPVRKPQPYQVGGSKPVTNMPVRKPQPFQVGGSKPLPVGSPRPVVPSRAAMEAKKTVMASDRESMKKADYSRVIQKRLAKKNTSKTLKKMVAKKSVKGSYRIGNGPNRASY